LLAGFLGFGSVFAALPGFINNVVFMSAICTAARMLTGRANPTINTTFATICFIDHLFTSLIDCYYKGGADT